MEIRANRIGAILVLTGWKRSFAYIVGTLAIISAVACLAQIRPESSSAADALRIGEYLSENYVNQLQETRSPYRAFKTGSPQLVIVEKQVDGTRLMPIFNFHEGGPEIMVRENGKVTVPVDAGLNVGNLIVSFSGPGQLVLGFGDFSPRRFVFVGKASAYVSKVILVGKYVDGLSRSYEFHDSGRAVFPDRQFAYSIGIDHVVNKFDYFVDNDSGKKYGYRVAGSKLYVYGTTGGLGQVEDTKPQLVLKRVMGDRN
jgi:hypothetical protein